MGADDMEGALNSSSATASGFEGFEKRLEVAFSPAAGSCMLSNAIGLRSLTREELDQILKPAQCTIVSELHNTYFDSYVLSESSLFVYPLHIILKTCGKTQLLNSIPVLLHYASTLSLEPCRCKYSRGAFIFPHEQPFPYTCFHDEVGYLDTFFGHMGMGAADDGAAGRNFFVLGDHASPHQIWHIYSAAMDNQYPPAAAPLFTVEMCMTQLDRKVASHFFNEDGSLPVREMTLQSGIGSLLPNAQLCDFGFAPCGYSMNGMEGPALSTIHITPEETHSYASFEVMGYNPQALDLGALLNRVAACFKPATCVISIHVSGWQHRHCPHPAATVGSWGSAVLPAGYECSSSSRQELPGNSVVVFHAFNKSSTAANCNTANPTRVLALLPTSDSDETKKVKKHCAQEEGASSQRLWRQGQLAGVNTTSSGGPGPAFDQLVALDGSLVTLVVDRGVNMEQLERCCPTAKLILRLRPEAGVHAAEEVVSPEVEQLLRLCKQLGLEMVGLALDLCNLHDGIKWVMKGAARKVFEAAQGVGLPPLRLLAVSEVLFSGVNDASTFNSAVEDHISSDMEVKVFTKLGGRVMMLVR